MKKAVKFALGALAVVLVVGLLVWSFLAHRKELASESESEKPIGNPARVTRSADGLAVVKFDRDMQQRVDIRTEPVLPTTKRQEVVAYGRLEDDPSRSFVLRAPVAGTVRGTADHPWPEVGQTLADRSAIGFVEPRLAPADRITLGDRLAAARAEVASSSATLAAAQAALNRARILNADDKNISDRALQEAETRVAAEEARLTAAGQSVRLIESSLASQRDAAAGLELDRGGQAVEVLAHPGESIESGQPILRVTRFDRLLARVDVPSGETVAPGLTAATIVPLGYESRPFRGEPINLAASVDPKTQGQPFLFRIADPSLTLRPGLSVTAYLEVPGPPRRGVVAPGSAVVRQAGKTWVYVQSSADSFTRREVKLEDPAAEGWFTRSLSPGDRVVTTGAQTLLSEELKSQIQVGEEGR
jgi:multidrug efflux pump subunit AcrA (membrane-fusion protein)